MKKTKVIITCFAMTALISLASCAKDEGFDQEKKITLYTRNTDSGTRDGFFTKIGLEEAKEDNAPLATVTTVESNGDMILKVKNDEYGIGYISLSSLEDSGLIGLQYENVEPTEENVLNESYQLTRNFNYVTRSEFDDDNKRQIVEAYLAYLTTIEAKATIIANSGIVEISATDPSWEDIKEDYPIANQDNSSITIKFGGSTSVENIAKALSAEFASKCGNFKYEHNHTGSSDAFKYTQGENKDDSAKLDIGFLSREFSDTEVCAANTFGKICVDAIVAVVHSSNPLRNVTAQDLVNAYTGVYTKWSELIA